MKGTQFEVVTNKTTIGWKLQGLSVRKLFVREYFSTNKNLAYVMLLQVRKRKD